MKQDQYNGSGFESSTKGFMLSVIET